MFVEMVKNMVLLVIGAACGVFAIYSIKKEPRRVLPGVLLVLCIYFTVTGGLHLYAPDRYTSDHTVWLGEGSEILFVIFIVFLLVCFFGGVALCVNGARLIGKEGDSAPHRLPIFFGVAGILLPVLYVAALLNALHAPTLAVIIQVVFQIIIYIPGMLAAFLLYSLVYAALPKRKDCDFILVLGAGLRGQDKVTPLLAGRLDKAVQVYRAGGSKAVFVVSGGKGKSGAVSEAHAMKQYLQEQGIPGQEIIMEEESVNTYENMVYSRQVMEQRKPGYSCIFVTSNFHVLRAAILARNVGLNAQGIGAKTAFYFLPYAFIREYLAVIFKYKKLAAIYIAVVLVYNLIINLLPT